MPAANELPTKRQSDPNIELNLGGLTNLSQTARAALQYERSNYVNGSVTTDPFYASLPAHAANATAGTLLKLEVHSNTSLYTLPPTTSLSRIVYQSRNANGTTVPVSAFVLWPYAPRRAKDGGYAVVAWAHGTSGIVSDCAPSHIRNLWQHFLAPYLLAMQGYVVVGTDYAGLGVSKDANNKTIIHEYLSAPAQAYDVIYSIEAARQAFPQLSHQWVAAGHSQGGGAVWGVAQIQVDEPTSGYLGAVAISPVTNLSRETGPTAPLFPWLMSPGLAAVFPGFQPQDILTPTGQQIINTLFNTNGCSGLLDVILPTTPVVRDGWQQNPYWMEYQKLVGAGNREIAGPLLVLQGENDPFLNFNLTEVVVNETVSQFPKSQLEFVSFPNVSHVPALQASQPTWMHWIKQRFDGVAVPNGHVRSVVQPAVPAAAQQPELNWFLGLATVVFETP